MDKTTIIEFLDSEPLENVITSLHYKVDKVIFVGFEEPKNKSNMESFLYDVCCVKEIEYLKVPRDDLPKIVSGMRDITNRERKEGNKVFFDVTGGEELVMVAFGILSTETETPMHMFDIRKDTLIEFEEGASYSISKDGIADKKDVTTEEMVKLFGGCIIPCEEGVKLDWDGIIQEEQDEEAYNQLSKIELRGYRLEFELFSRKTGDCTVVGKTDKARIMKYLYKLDAIALRFGGKYAKKVIRKNHVISETNLERAKELGIKFKNLSDLPKEYQDKPLRLSQTIDLNGIRGFIEE